MPPHIENSDGDGGAGAPPSASAAWSVVTHARVRSPAPLAAPTHATYTHGHTVPEWVPEFLASLEAELPRGGAPEVPLAKLGKALALAQVWHPGTLRRALQRWAPDVIIADPKHGMATARRPTPEASEIGKLVRKLVLDLRNKSLSPRARTAIQAELKRLFADVANLAETLLGKLDLLNQALALVDLPAMSSVTKAREALRSVNINLFDIVDALACDAAGKDREQLQVFKTTEELAHYSKANGLIFRKEDAKASMLLKEFLKPLRMYWSRGPPSNVSPSLLSLHRRRR